MSLSHKVDSSASQIFSITVPGVRGVDHISVVTSDRLWVSNEGHLLQVDSKGHVLHDKLIVGLIPTGNHTVTEDADLLFIYGKKIRKLKSDGNVSTLLTTDWGANCIYSSRINSDVLVGCYNIVTRYDRTGRKLQVIEKDDEGQSLYRFPVYITENKNGDIWTSDAEMKAVVVVDKSGRHRFNYTGRHSLDTGRQSEDTGFQTCILPSGICTDVLGHVLVCDWLTNSVHLLDQDGQFLSLLLTREHHGIRCPRALCVDDKLNLYLGQRGRNTIKVKLTLY